MHVTTAGTQVLTRKSRCEHNCAASLEEQWQRGYGPAPASVSSHATVGVKPTRSSCRQKLKSVLQAIRLVVFKKEMPAAPRIGCESARPANQSLKRQEKKHEHLFKATPKWGELVEKLKLLNKHKSCLVQKACIRKWVECPLKSRNAPHSSSRRDRTLSKPIAVFASRVATEPASVKLINKTKRVQNFSTNAWDAASAFANAQKKTLLYRNGSHTDDSKTLVAAEDFGGCKIPEVEIISDSELAKFEIDEAASQGEGQGPPIESISFGVRKPVPLEVIAESTKTSEGRLLAATESGPFQMSSYSCLNSDRFDLTQTLIPSGKYNGPLFIKDRSSAIPPVFCKEFLATIDLDNTTVEPKTCSAYPSTEKALGAQHSARTGPAEETPYASETVQSTIPGCGEPKTTLERWMCRPKGHLWDTLEMEAILVPKLDSKSLKLACLDVDLNFLNQNEIVQTFSQYLARMRIMIHYERPTEFSRLEDLEFSGIKVTPAPQFKGVSELDLYLHQYYSPKKNTGPLSSLSDRVQFEDAMMLQCRKWLVAHYEFQDQIASYLLSLLRKVQSTGEAFVKICTDMACNLRDEGLDFDYDHFLDDYLDDFWYLADCLPSSVKSLDALDCYDDEVCAVHIHSGPHSSHSPSPRNLPDHPLLDHYEERLLGIMEDLEALEEMEQSITDSIENTDIGCKSTLVNIFRGYQNACSLQKRYRDEFHEAWKQMEGNVALSDTQLDLVIDCISPAHQPGFLEECIDLRAGKVLDRKMHQAKGLCQKVSSARAGLRSTYDEVTSRFLSFVYDPKGD